MSTANAYLASCVKAGCGVGDYWIDQASVSAVYNGYCNGLGYFAAAAATAITTAVSISGRPAGGGATSPTTRSQSGEVMPTNTDSGGASTNGAVTGDG